MAMRWYVIKALSGRENTARQLIESQLKGLKLDQHVERLLVPTERVTEVKRGKKVNVERKLYPGYIYVLMDSNEDVLEVINGVDGVTGFLGSDPNHPEPLSAEEAERIIRIAETAGSDEQRAAMVHMPFKVGDQVKVKEGTFAGMEGQVAEINAEKGQLRVVIVVFGRQTPLWLEVWQVEEVG